MPYNKRLFHGGGFIYGWGLRNTCPKNHGSRTRNESRKNRTLCGGSGWEGLSLWLKMTQLSSRFSLNCVFKLIQPFVAELLPSQKAKMIESVRALKKRDVTLAVGDGANDIAMIQSADIGVGITGQGGTTGSAFCWLCNCTIQIFTQVVIG